MKATKFLHDLADIPIPTIIPTFEDVTKNQCAIIVFKDGTVIEFANDGFLEIYESSESLEKYIDYLGFDEAGFNEMYELDEEFSKIVSLHLPEVDKVYMGDL